MIKYLYVVSIRFGEESLHSCEVMLKDIEDSKRVNNAIHRHAALNQNSSGNNRNNNTTTNNNNNNNASSITTLTQVLINLEYKYNICYLSYLQPLHSLQLLLLLLMLIIIVLRSKILQVLCYHPP